MVARLVPSGHRQPDRRFGRPGTCGRQPASSCWLELPLPPQPVSIPRGRASLTPSATRAFFILFSVVIGLWLCVMIYGSYVWNLCLAYYRVLGIGMTLLILVVGALLAGSGQGERRDRPGHARVDRRGNQVRLLGLLCARMELPVQPGSMGTRNRSMDSRANGPLHGSRLAAGPGVLHEAEGASIAQPPLPRDTKPGDPCKFVLLLPPEFENWPHRHLRSLWWPGSRMRPPASGSSPGRPGRVPLPPGRDPAWISSIRKNGGATVSTSN